MNKTVEKVVNQIKRIQITLPVAILIGAIALSISFYVVQKDKSRSIERQYRENILMDSKQKQLEAKRDECESLSAGLKKQWYNVIGVSYKENYRWGTDLGECWVTYKNTETGEIESAPLSSMGDSE